MPIETPITVREFLQPGDVLLYRPDGFWGHVIALKTWHDVSHCEGYTGGGESVASRDGIGVNRFPLRLEKLGYVLRPHQPIDLAAAMAWFETVKGQKYDWVGLLRFVLVRWARHGGTPKTGMFCSSFLNRWLRAGGVQAFNPAADSDAIVPASFLDSLALTQFTVDGDTVHFTEEAHDVA